MICRSNISDIGNSYALSLTTLGFPRVSTFADCADLHNLFDPSGRQRPAERGSFP